MPLRSTGWHSGEMTIPRLRLVVLRTADVPGSRRLYEALGLTFVEERHGSGPTHVSSEVGSTVIELYPLKDPGSVPVADVRIGFEVEDLDAVVGEVRAHGARVHSEIAECRGQRIAVVVDLDGRKIELTEAPHGGDAVIEAT